ncbi:MAG TPA: hypothetical protein PLJ35_01265 [Anaerolineae bacterium]|nr:hypothetical protein [Anaerolineae bacterium]
MKRRRAKASHFDSIDNPKDSVSFRVFVPGSLPDGMVFLQGQVLRFVESGEVWEARIDFGPQDTREPLISLAARPVFSRPYPVKPVVGYPRKEADQRVLEEEFFVIKPQKVSFTPRPGIMLPTEQGYVLQWIKQDVLYTMFMEHTGWREMPEAVGKALVEG